MATRKNEVVPEVEDYTGDIDGGGVKGCMFVAKLPLELIVPGFIVGIARVLGYGREKYAANNWLRGMSWTTVYGGVQRHLTAWYMGEEYDLESKLSHLFHAACGIMFLVMYSVLRPHLYGQFDDRVFLDEGEDA